MKRSGSFMVLSIFTGVLMLSAMFVPVSVSQKPVDEVKGTPPGWSDDINLSTDAAHRDLVPEVAVNENNVHVVWLNNYTNVYYAKSNDNGANWISPISLYNATSNCQYPDIAVNNNSVHVVWSRAYKIFYRNSTDNGETWSQRKFISNVSTALAQYSRIFVNGDNVHISWFDEQDGSDGEVYYRRSLDGGTIFDNGQGVDQDRRITYSPSVVTKPLIAGYNKNISVTWMDERNGDFEIYWMISKDNGNTWEDGLGNIGIERRLTFTGVTDYSLGVSGSNIYIVWNKYVFPGPDYTLYYCNSSDNGLTWSPAQILSGPSPAMGPPDINVYGKNISVVWQDRRDDGTHEQVFLTNSTNGGTTWIPDLRLTYNLSRQSQIPKLVKINDITHLVRIDSFSGDNDIFYKRYPDFPDLSPPDHSNETPPPDTYKDAPGTNVSVHVTDPSGVNESTIQLYVNGSLVSPILTPITDGYNVSWESGGFNPGVVTCRIVADDNCSNTLDYTWNFTVLATYIIALDEGWNLMSVPFIQVDTSISEVLKDISGKWDYIRTYDAPTDSWQSNSVLKPTQLNDFDVLDHKTGFWIHVTEPNVNLTVRGNIPVSTSMSLYAGWNLVGYPSMNTETVGNALFGTGADAAMVCNITEPYHVKEVGPTYIMKPGEGYWVHVPADSVWVVNW